MRPRPPWRLSAAWALLGGLLLGGGGGCGYRVVARPELPGGLERVWVSSPEYRGSEAEVSRVVGAQLSSALEAYDRLGAAGGANTGRLQTRVEALRMSPSAFPGQLGSAATYVLQLRGRLRLVGADGAALAEVGHSVDESYLAGVGPEETEANARRALERAARRWTEEALARLFDEAAPLDAP